MNLILNKYSDIFIQKLNYGNPDFWMNLIVGFCFMVIIFFVINNFIDQNPETKLKKSKKSIVETFSMTLFFLLIYYMVILKVAIYRLPPNYAIFFQIFGLIIIIFGTFFNVWGRLHLKTNRANHIKIYKNHYLVNTGPYRIVRHPLYASLIWMSYAVGIIYSSRGVILATSLVFLPMMIYRAKQEEQLLTKSFPEYAEYQKNVGLFLPKFK